MKYDFLNSEVLARLGALPVESRLAMIGIVAGKHRSPHRGSSVEFAEYRKYVAGDDTRRLDWKAYARSDRHYIKEFEADTNLRAYFVVDCSGSMKYASGEHDSDELRHRPRPLPGRTRTAGRVSSPGPNLDSIP